MQPSAALRWVLLRAFGPIGQFAPEGGREAHRLAARLSLSSRIGARHRGESLARELGEDEAGLFERDFRSVVAAALRFEHVQRDLTAAALELGVDLVFLKGAALELAGFTRPGARPAGDVDVLVSPEAAPRFQEALVARGYHAGAAAGYEHQLPALTHPNGAVVEVHRLVLGVRLTSGRGSATVDELREAQQLRPLEGFPRWIFTPEREVLAAHALVHGLVQHGFAPHAYPLARLFGDLLDLGFGVPAGASLSNIERWLARELDAEELAGALRLAAMLGEGDLRPLDEDPRDGVESALLHHALAGALDERYGESLRFRMLARPLSDRRAGAWASLWSAVAPARAELEQLYGRPAGPLGAVGQRLRRPLDLLGRALRYGASALFSRSRR